MGKMFVICEICLDKPPDYACVYAESSSVVWILYQWSEDILTVITLSHLFKGLFEG